MLFDNQLLYPLILERFCSRPITYQSSKTICFSLHLFPFALLSFALLSFNFAPSVFAYSVFASSDFPCFASTPDATYKSFLAFANTFFHFQPQPPPHFNIHFDDHFDPFSQLPETLTLLGYFHQELLLHTLSNKPILVNTTLQHITTYDLKMLRNGVSMLLAALSFISLVLGSAIGSRDNPKSAIVTCASKLNFIHPVKGQQSNQLLI